MGEPDKAVGIEYGTFDHVSRRIFQIELPDEFCYLATWDVRKLARAQLPQENGWLAGGVESLFVGQKQVVIELVKGTRSECSPGGSVEGPANLHADPASTCGLGVHAICVLTVHRPLGSHNLYKPGNELGRRRVIWVGERMRLPYPVCE